MAVTEQAVYEELKKVIDPELFVNIVDLGLIYLVELLPEDSPSEASPNADGPNTDGPNVGAAAATPTGQRHADGQADSEAPSDPTVNAEQGGDSEAAGKVKVAIEMTMTSPACPAGPQLIQNSKSAVGRLEGVSSVEVKIVMEPPWTPDKMTEDARDQLGIF